MTKSILTRALIVSVIGTGVLWVVGRLLEGLVGSPSDLVVTTLGSFVATSLFARRPTVGFLEALRPATAIVFFTLVVISIADALAEVFIRRHVLDFQPVGKFIWAVTATSWWLIPCTAGILALLSRASRSKALSTQASSIQS